MISTSIVDPVTYEKIVVDEAHAYTEVLPSGLISDEYDYPDEVSDSEDDSILYGFSKNDPTILRSTSRNIDLKIFYRYDSLTEVHWNPTRSITSHRKRNSTDMSKTIFNTFAGDNSVNATPQHVPKRRRIRKTKPIGSINKI